MSMMKSSWLQTMFCSSFIGVRTRFGLWICKFVSHYI